MQLPTGYQIESLVKVSVIGEPGESNQGFVEEDAIPGRLPFRLVTNQDQELLRNSQTPQAFCAVVNLRQN